MIENKTRAKQRVAVERECLELQRDVLLHRRGNERVVTEQQAIRFVALLFDLLRMLRRARQLGPWEQADIMRAAAEWFEGRPDHSMSLLRRALYVSAMRADGTMPEAHYQHEVARAGLTAH
jgi:hypothetical protein